MTATFHVGDAIEVMSKLPEKSVDLVLTSPPFLALRSYLPADHPDKAKEGGSQSTPGEFIDWLIDVVEACDRVLAPHGSLAIELGDTYAGSSSGNGDPRFQTDERNQPGFAAWTGANRDGAPGGTGWPLAKSLSLIPELFRFTLVYGFNPLTGRQTERWRLRNVIRWVRPNPPVGALGDKFRPATSELMVFCKSAKRYFDLDAVREPYKPGQSGAALSFPANRRGSEDGRRSGGVSEQIAYEGAGAPPLDWWNVPLLEGEEPSKYGPKPPLRQDHTVGVVYRGSGHERQPGDGRFQGEGEEKRIMSNPAGAPPLDWWNIPLLEGEEETRYGPKGPKPWGPRHYYGSAEKGVGNQTKSTDKGEHRINEGNPLGAPPLDWWEIPPGGYEGAHYAVFPPELCVKPVKAMCPEKVCRVCGEPSRRITEPTEEYASRPNNGRDFFGQDHDRGQGMSARAALRPGSDPSRKGATFNTLGWTTCGHDDWRPGLILDPFVGSGTTLMVATGHGRDAIGIDLDERNYELALQRVGPFILERAS